ncbi:mechanosensitive ion channel family protein [Paraburkholderia sp. SOS3]|uniref:mechanosensitive ion channel family protein n=1 Tax=Paraburkholderia sp. SOS3 TaxID=1926494 RepID=UPI00094767EA|nr:mechanosensitive ion channel family protein [Paraburkholderia sp. SOS3]APR36249.1 mechanosensitive ion channel protein MscS [Paraburkholderia sp. SOS3]
MKSCPPRRECRAAPNAGGRSAHSALSRAVSAFAIFSFCCALACLLLMPRAAHAAGGPVLPALQSLINSATAAPASAASAATAASAPSPASQAELNHSLDSVITTLDNDRQRTALVAQLKKLREATQTVGPVAPAQPGPGLLGAIASGIASVEADVNRGRTPISYWSGRLNAAGNELYTIVSSQGREKFGRILLDMFAMLAGWGACAAALIYVQRKLHARYGIVVRLNPNPTTRELLIFALRRVGPWIVAFVAALMFARSMPDALGRTLAMVIAYAIVAGAVFSAICLIMFSLFGSGHRRAAVQLLIEHARRMLFAIGICSALGDAATNYEVAHQLGTNLAALISTVSNMTAAALTAYFALAFRRPVAHLICNRSYEQRHGHKVATDAFDVLGSLWHLPMLVLAIASVVATIGGMGSGENVLQISVITALLLVLAFFLSAIVIRITRPQSARRRRRSPYVTRLTRFAGTLLMLVIWLAYFELAARLWDISLARVIEESVTARGIAHAMTAIVATLFLSWLVWILVDTAILEALNPANPRNKSHNPSMRARTMLPLLRNVLFVLILTVAGIVTAANLGINVTPLLAGAGVIGLAIGFGAQSLVADLITGLFIILEDTISVGDWIDVDGGHAGTVEYLSIRTVRLRDGQGAIHAIPFSQIKIVKNLSRDFAYAVFEVRVPFSADVDEVTQLIRAVGADLMADFRYRREMLGPVEVWGLDRFDPNWMVVKGQIKTRPLQQWSVARAFNLRLKRMMDQAGIEIPVPQMRIFTGAQDQQGEPFFDNAATSRRDAAVDEADHEALRAAHETDGGPAPRASRANAASVADMMPAFAATGAGQASAALAAAPARDVSHEPRPAPPSTGQTASVPPQIPTAGESGKS